MRSRERRFMGKSRTWTIACSKCKTISKPINSGARAFAPKAIVKKLTQMGWFVADNPKNDMCPECVRAPVKARTKQAAQVLADVQAPMVTVNGDHRVHFTELKAVVSTLDHEHAKELIKLLKQQIPAKPPKTPKAAPPPKMAQSDYEKWLDEQDKGSNQ